MRNLSLTEIEQVNGGVIFELVNIASGALLGAAWASTLGAVNLAGSGYIVPVQALAAAGAIVGASMGFSVTRSNSSNSSPYYYF